MIPSIVTPWDPNAWTSALREAFRDPRALLDHLGVDDHEVDENPDFPMLVPLGFAKRMQPDRSDPLLLQVLPTQTEKCAVAGFVADPLKEHASDVNKAPALIQKYEGRALLLATSGCAINCRYCFRRHFPYDEQRPGNYDAALDHVERDTRLTEIILSGGDPLLLSDRSIADLFARLNRLGHIERIRIHSRIPIVLPERMTADLLETFARSRADVVVVTHANHAQELDGDTHRALECLKSANVWLLNQAVLLKNVNATPGAQIALAHALFKQGVLPYYLHLPDRVRGTHHFFVEPETAQAIYQKMQATLPGYLLPRLVREDAGAPAKTIVSEIAYDPPTI
jgi:EF-P beta-lysylation protein EpmB